MFNINQKLFNEIKIYCDLNNIEDIDFYINRLIAKSFTTDKYGTLEKKEQNIYKVEVDKKIDVKEEPIINNKIDDDYEKIYDDI